MDAFAVAICRGLSLKELNFKNSLTVGLYFGVFQAGMPLLGYFLGIGFADKIKAFDHWIAFILLSLIGTKMIWDSVHDTQCADDSCATSYSDELCLKPSIMVPAAVATSIDALAIGVSFAFLHVNIGAAVSMIGIITLIISMIGVYIGSAFGSKYKSKAEFAGGVILIFMGLKILIEHTLIA